MALTQERKKYLRRWYRKNIVRERKRAREHAREWRKKNPEKAQKQDQVYRKKYKKRRNEYSKKYYQQHKDNLEFKKNRNRRSLEYYYRHKDRVRCRQKTKQAIQKGILTKPPFCENYDNSESCSDKIVAHHPDYSKPLKVKWLCEKCHNELHETI